MFKSNVENLSWNRDLNYLAEKNQNEVSEYFMNLGLVLETPSCDKTNLYEVISSINDLLNKIHIEKNKKALNRIFANTSMHFKSLDLKSINKTFFLEIYGKRCLMEKNKFYSFLLSDENVYNLMFNNDDEILNIIKNLPVDKFNFLLNVVKQFGYFVDTFGLSNFSKDMTEEFQFDVFVPNSDILIHCDYDFESGMVLPKHNVRQVTSHEMGVNRESEVSKFMNENYYDIMSSIPLNVNDLPVPYQRTLK